MFRGVKYSLLLLTGIPFFLFSQEVQVSQHLEITGASGEIQTELDNSPSEVYSVTLTVEHPHSGKSKRISIINSLSMEASYEVQ